MEEGAALLLKGCGGVIVSAMPSVLDLEQFEIL